MTYFDIRHACPACGSRERTIISTVPYTNEPLASYMRNRFPGIPAEALADVPYEIAQCKQCRLLYQTHIPTDTLEQHIYQAEKTEESLREKSGAEISFFIQKARECERIALLINKKPTDTRVLEFGSGWGNWLLIARALGYNAEGVEIMPERRKQAAANGLIVHESLDTVTGTFDYIYTDQVFEHLADPKQCLARLIERLIPGGILDMHVPNGNKIHTKIKTFSNKPPKEIAPLVHINCFTHQALMSFGMQAGLLFLSPKMLFADLLRRTLPMRSAVYAEEALKAWRRQTFSTNLYFRKPY